MQTHLFSKFQLRDLNFRNRIFVAPMCQYSAQDGLANSWHAVHLGSRAVGGAGLIICEATAVAPEGRITPADLGLWNDQQAQGLRGITEFIREQGSVAGIQLAHAGRKASTDVPWRGGKALPDWIPVAPSAIAFGPAFSTPREMTTQDIESVVQAFSNATQLSLKAGFQVVEIHMAHGYLLHQFLSPLSNQRRDEYGGGLENRMKLSLRVAAEVRKEWPANLPVFVRLSATDWMEGGWDQEQSIVLVNRLKALGIDFIDCSTGGLVPNAKIPVGPGFQVPFAEAIRKTTDIPTGAVGLITEARQAEEILAEGKADAILIARQSLRDPYWPFHAAKELGVDFAWPDQYARAK